ncbi:hypothetical protein EVAR_40536_1 [Eumeta japonica]|uniref:Uncharacterized protein n=1 Tax=Eumeta variegata TaxID=151549 RepID=A0A4C1XWB7_EUMVA|nr:hypothetical protein EVAR_40536_1 [Eumeta japonica]
MCRVLKSEPSLRQNDIAGRRELIKPSLGEVQAGHLARNEQRAGPILQGALRRRRILIVCGRCLFSTQTHRPIERKRDRLFRALARTLGSGGTPSAPLFHIEDGCWAKVGVTVTISVEYGDLLKPYI